MANLYCYRICVIFLIRSFIAAFFQMYGQIGILVQCIRKEMLLLLITTEEFHFCHPMFLLSDLVPSMRTNHLGHIPCRLTCSAKPTTAWSPNPPLPQTPPKCPQVEMDICETRPSPPATCPLEGKYPSVKLFLVRPS